MPTLTNWACSEQAQAVVDGSTRPVWPAPKNAPLVPMSSNRWTTLYFTFSRLIFCRISAALLSEKSDSIFQTEPPSSLFIRPPILLLVTSTASTRGPTASSTASTPRTSQPPSHSPTSTRPPRSATQGGNSIEIVWLQF